MDDRISRLAFLKKIWVGIFAAFLSSCKRLNNTPSSAETPVPTARLLPTKEETPTSTPTPALLEYCGREENVESFLSGVFATRVEELENGVYKIVIDKNINASVLYAEIEYNLIGDLNPDSLYQVLLLDENEDPIKAYDAIYYNQDGQLRAIIQGLREGESGWLVCGSVLSADQVEECLQHADFNGNIIQYEGIDYLIIGDRLFFEDILVKSRQSNPNNPNNPNPTPGCFSSETNILMADETTKTIEEIINDFNNGNIVKIKSFDFKKSKLIDAKVLKVAKPILDGIFLLRFDDDTELRVSDDHPIFIMRRNKQSWASLNPKKTYESHKIKTIKIKINDLFMKPNMEYKRLLSYRFIEQETQTFNLTQVEKPCNFFTEEVLVHNKGGEDDDIGSG